MGEAIPTIGDPEYQCLSISSLAEKWGCPPHHVEELWRQGELPAFSLGIGRGKNLTRLLRFTPKSYIGKEHLVRERIFPPPPEPKLPKPNKVLPDLAVAILAAAKTKDTYAPMPNERPRGPGFVYFIRCGEYVKVGFTKNPQERTKSLRSMTPYPTKMLKVIAGTMAGERAIHKVLAEYHHHFEWFRLEDTLREAIALLPGRRPRHG
jgi:hypothetical protein